jgi:short-subunit dehydrogenase
MGFADKYGPWGVVLGASEGLGEAYAHGLAARGLNVVVAARRREQLQRVADEVAEQHGVQARAVALDLATADFLDLLRAVTDELEVGLVVYNGAAAHVGPFLEGADSIASIVAVNCTGPLVVCQHFGQQLLDRGRGGIVLMGSAAGLAGSAYNSAYAASKAFDLVLGESLWAEWRDQGVDVLAVIGPAIDTPTYRRSLSSEQRANMPAPMDPAVAVEQVLDALGTDPSFVPGEVGEMIAMLGTLPRRQQVEALSKSQAQLAKGRASSSS